MKKQIIIEQLEKIIEEEKANMNDYSIQFIEENKNYNYSYLCDAFNDFADNNISIWKYEQRKYYSNNEVECEIALLENCNGETIAEIIKKEGIQGLIEQAAIYGWFEEINFALNENIERIKKVLAINKIIEELNNGEVVEEDIEDLEETIKSFVELVYE